MFNYRGAAGNFVRVLHFCKKTLAISLYLCYNVGYLCDISIFIYIKTKNER